MKDHNGLQGHKCGRAKREQLMKVRILILALAIIAGAVMPGGRAYAGPRPATSASTSAIDPGTVVTILKAAYDIYKLFSHGGQSGQDATAQIIAAINSARTDIINHIDAIATAQAKACALAAVIDFPNFEALTPDSKQLFALNATSCITLIDSLLSTVSDKAAVDQLGFALNSVGPIALIVRSRTNLSNTGLVPVLVRANQRVIAVLAPVCQRVFEDTLFMYECYSYNGDTSIVPQITVQRARAEAGRRTSWAVAQAVLPTLTSL